MLASMRGEFVGLVTEDGFARTVAPPVRPEKYSDHARGSHTYAGTAPAAATSTTTDEATTTISPGATVTGTVNTAGDIDVFNINLVAGQTYSISLAGSGGSALIDPYVWLRKAGVEFAHDDDGGQGTDSLLTFKVTTSGTYQISAGAFPDSGLTGGYTLTVLKMGTDSVASTRGSATAIATDSTTHGFVETSGDVDVYAVTLQAGLYYSFDLAGGADYESPSPLPAGELNTRITIYNANGNQVAFNDNLADDNLSSGVGFVAQASGTYYVQVAAATGQTGGYNLGIEGIDLSTKDPLDTVDWGSQLPSRTVTVYFARNGETFDGVRSLGWTEYEISRAMAALNTFAEVSGLTFTRTTSASGATFRLVTTSSDEFLGYFNPPGTNNAGVGVFATNGTAWNTTGSLEQGGSAFATLIHEFGHGLGLAHPHDNGGTSQVMPGVTTEFGSYGVFDLNQGVYTTMSYNDGWRLSPNTPNATSTNGNQSGPGPLDIALIQQKYGTSNNNGGNTVYTLPGLGRTSYEAIWDTGGTDTIRYAGSISVRIDLTAATLDYSATGAGAISYVTGVAGGFTIAAGVVIEKATGGSGDDVLIGNSARNILTGGIGADAMKGRGGNDQYSVDNAGDNVIEVANEGTDKVIATLSYTLTSNVENLTLTGSGAINATGNSLANIIVGNSAANVLNGGAGNDTVRGGAGNDSLIGAAGNDSLTGGTGADKFVFNAALSTSSNVDRISDFSVIDDTMLTDNDVFTAIGPIGTLSAAAFRTGIAARDADDRIIYDSATGKIYYDADGSGAGAQVLFAQVTAGLALTNVDFQIVG